MKLLQIDTSQKGKVVVKCVVGSDEWVEERDQKFGSQVLLNMIEEVLKKGRVEMKELEGIEVETGPGSYTGIRVGVSVANALSFALGIPVNGKQMETDLIY
jgi:tRNA threonylcarbamoyladenosine biosynthesis protein TsaB